MPAEAAATPVAAIEGIKRVKVVPAKRPSQPAHLSIVYTADRIKIAEMPFELQVNFTEAGAQTVNLTAQDQCGAEAVMVFDTLAQGLLAKYPERLGSRKGLTEEDARQAKMHSLQSRKREILSYWYANDEVAVIVLIAVGIESPPPLPDHSSKLAYTLWQLAKSQYDTIKAECGGTGDERMNILLRYTTRASFEAELARVKSEIKADRAKLTDQL
jgi:hypothetical protein